MKYFIFIFILFILKTLQKADVYYTREITSSSIVKMFKKLNIHLKGRVGLKVHSGETGGKFFLTPDFLQEIYDYTNGTFIECNAAYNGGRNTTERHKELLKDHGWYNKSRRTVIMDEDSTCDKNLSIDNPIIISENIVGEHIENFNSCIVLSHFKGNRKAGFGGALKQLSIGFASQAGKTWIHTAGNITEWQKMDDFLANDLNFTAAMGDAASSIFKYFNERGGIAFINVLANISLYCDCAGGEAPEPRIHDMGVFASTDPVAIDRACLDMIIKHVDKGTKDLLEQIKNLSGTNILFSAEKHNIGSQEYNLIDVDEPEYEHLGLIIFISIIFFVILVVGILSYFCFRNNNKSKDKNISLIETKKEE